MNRYPWLTLLALALAHGLNDLLAGWALAAQAYAGSPTRTLLFFLGYNAVAFGGQVPLALGLERWGHYGRAAVLALGGLALASLLPPGGAVLAVGLLALSSALYHVAGGTLAMSLPLPPALAAGCFAAPGVLGLALGRWLSGAYAAGLPAWLSVPLALALALLLRGAPAVAPVPPPALRRLTPFQGLLLLVLALAALRSALWNFSSLRLETAPGLELTVAAAAAAGKVLGGWWMRRRWVVEQVSGTLAAAVLLLLAPELPLAARLLGIALLQSTIPVGVVLLAELLRGRLALANALIMGLTVVLGAFTAWLHSPLAGLATGSALLLLTYLFARYWPGAKPRTSAAAAVPAPAASAR